MARIGRYVFHDASLSGSGLLSCASCHSPTHFYGPPNGNPAMYGGPALSRQGVRAVPSLMYLEREPAFAIGPDNAEDETGTLAPMLARSVTAARATKSAGDPAAASANLVPQGGLFWDGRADTLQQQALVPLLDPLEMDGGSLAAVATKLRRAAYAPHVVELFGPGILNRPRLLVVEALFAVARYQVEDPSFHPYTSKFDFWLEGRARFTPAEARGYALFNDPQRANCAGCHLDRPGPDGTPPLFTDHQFEALSPPRNLALHANRDPAYFDLGLCGPYRRDLHTEARYCGLFVTPTLRNVATRHVFFHNGVFHSLQQVLDFYAFRDVDPARVYPRGTDGHIAVNDDLPPGDRANIDNVDAPFGRHPGEAPAITAGEERDIIAFLGTLTDGYAPPPAAPSPEAAAAR